METLTVTLKQHTPLIHFQHDQEGATLRASEVKPKLDKFIIEKAFHNDYNQCKTYLVGYDEKAPDKLKKKFEEGYRALDYKMKILITNPDKTEEYMIVSYMKKENISALKIKNIKVLNNTPYFAQEEETKNILDNPQLWEDGKIPKKGLLYPEDITVSITSSYKELLNNISEHIQAFFLINNFGTRQNKGFGCFEVKKIKLNSEEKKLQANNSILKGNFSFVYLKSLNNGSLNSIFSQINKDYKILKSGESKNNIDSKLMLFGIKHLKCRWEKTFLKNKINNVFQTENNDYYQLKSSNQDDKKGNQLDYKFVRALLGLAEQYEFLLENPPKRDSNNKMIVKVTNANSIQRYQSPLLFKVIDKTIYLVGNDIPSEIFGKKFKFYVTIQKDEEAWKDEEITPAIEVPTDFSLKNFIEFAMNNNNNNARLGYTIIK